MVASTSPAAKPTETRQCADHGDYVARNLFGTIWTGCDTCDAEKEAAARAERDRVARVERIAARYRRSGVVGRFEKASSENYVATLPEQAKALASARHAVATFDPRRWAPVGLLGKPGTGKTHLQSAIANAINSGGDFDAVVYTSREIISKLRARWGKSDASEAEQEVKDWLVAVDLLIIDELGVGSGTDNELTLLFDIVDLRYRLERSVFFASNLTPRDLRGAIGDRLYDRLTENATIIPCDWPSYRREIRA